MGSPFGSRHPSVTIHSILNRRPPEKPIGIYIQMGLDRSEIYRLSKTSVVCPATGPCDLNPVDAQFAAQFSTTLRRLKELEFDLLLNHGYEVADATMAAWVPTVFDGSTDSQPAKAEVGRLNLDATGLATCRPS